MNDQEFIELLNLYVDREISAQDARRLEAEVEAHPHRRRVYDQYCRMQKACSMLAEESAEASSSESVSETVAFPSQSPWRVGPVFVGMAAAACLIVAVGLRNRVATSSGESAPVAARVASPGPVADTADLASDSMKPVFIARLPAPHVNRGNGDPLFAQAEPMPQMAQLNWIGDIHLTPVYSIDSPDFLTSPRADLKAAVLAEPQGDRDVREPVEMAAFRFQR